MRYKRSVADKLFRAVCLGFSAFLLLMSLICNVGIMWTQARIDELQSGMDLARRESEILSVRFENRISLSELEERATKELGMHRPGAGQIIIIDE